jgi:aminoglycoside phosphotransferase (APT) family kinase protein
VADTTAVQSRLEAFFRKRSDDPEGVRVVGYEPIIGGYSRAMARVRVEDSSGCRGYVVRADPPAGHSIIDTDRGQEWALLSALHRSGTIPLPAPLWFDETGDELGSPAIVMEMLEAESLLARGRQATDPSVFAEFDRKLSEVAAAIHTFDLEILPSHLAVPASWDDYIEGRVQRWVDAERRYPSGNPIMRFVAAWLRANKPPPAPFALVHSDFQGANILVDGQGEFFAIDWELAHVGDPREDLGWWILGGALQAPEIPDPTEENFYAPYREATGLSEEQVNPATIAYFIVLASEAVFTSVVEQLALVAMGKTTAMTVAYMTNAVVGMHGEFIKAIDLNESTLGRAR